MTTITSQAPAIQPGSPELEELLERIAAGAEARERELGGPRVDRRRRPRPHPGCAPFLSLRELCARSWERRRGGSRRRLTLATS